jgi:hypothetical protein
MTARHVRSHYRNNAFGFAVPGIGPAEEGAGLFVGQVEHLVVVAVTAVKFFVYDQGLGFLD